MLEKIIINICDQMSEILTQKQVQELKNVLYMNFHNKKVVEETTSIIPTEQDPDMIKIKMFVASKKVSGCAESSLKKYVYDIMKFKDAINKPFDEIVAMDVRWYLAMCQEIKKNKLTTIEGIRSSLYTFYSFLELEDLIKNNPMKRVEPVKIPTEIKKAFSAQEMEAIRSACEDIRKRAIIELLYSTGLRVSELCSLNIGDIDIYKQEFTVVGKGNKERKLYISDTAWFHLYRYILDRCKTENCMITSLKDAPLFVNKNKKRLAESGVQWILRDIGRRANIENVHPHRFRRTFATDLLSRGMKIEEVMLLMGHAKIETTLIYCDIKDKSIKSSFYKCS